MKITRKLIEAIVEDIRHNDLSDKNLIDKYEREFNAELSKFDFEPQVMPKIAEEITADLKLFASLTVRNLHIDKNEWQNLNGYGCLLKAAEKIRIKYAKKQK